METNKFFNFKEALPKSEYMAEKADRQISYLENNFYSKLGVDVLAKITSASHSGKRHVDVCLVDKELLESIHINIKKINKALKYYEHKACNNYKNHLTYRYENNKFYKALNYRESAVYHVLMDLIDKNYLVTLFWKKEIEGDGLRYEYTYHLPYMNIVW